MDTAKIGPQQVERAVAGIKRATVKLIDLLKSPDEAVRAGAADALRGLDPPPILDMITSLFKARDTAFQVEIIKVLSGLGEDFRTPVVLAASQLWQGADPAVRQAIIDAVLFMGPAPVEPNPTPAGASPTQVDAPGGRARTRPSPSRPGR
jgi:hypothetical protein